jgi:hypothetical protein
MLIFFAINLVKVVIVWLARSHSCTGNGKVPTIQSMAESRGSDSNVELIDLRINQTLSAIEN